MTLPKPVIATAKDGSKTSQQREFSPCSLKQQRACASALSLQAARPQPQFAATIPKSVQEVILAYTQTTAQTMVPCQGRRSYSLECTYSDSGSDKTVVLIHGNGNHSNGLSTTHLAALYKEAGFNVIQVTAPGFGNSLPKPIRVNDWKADASLLIDQVVKVLFPNTKTLALSGESMGGGRSLEYRGTFKSRGPDIHCVPVSSDFFPATLPKTLCLWQFDNAHPKETLAFKKLLSYTAKTPKIPKKERVFTEKNITLHLGEDQELWSKSRLFPETQIPVFHETQQAYIRSFLAGGD